MSAWTISTVITLAGQCRCAVHYGLPCTTTGCNCRNHYRGSCETAVRQVTP